MKSIGYILVLWLGLLCFAVPASANPKNTDLPDPFSTDTNPQAQKAYKLLFSATPGDYDKGIAQLQVLAQDTATQSSAFLALALAVVEKDQPRARKYLETCVQHAPENSDCQVWLGLYYQFGTGGKKDGKAAVRAFTASADTGSPMGQWHLGMAYLKGIGVKTDEKKAFQLVHAAAKQDYTAALNSYGVMKALGQGTKKDEKASFLAMARAAHFGDAQAIFSVGYCYEKGLGVKADADMADSAYVMASKLGHRPSLELVYKLLISIPDADKQSFWDASQARNTALEKVFANAKLPD